MKDYLHLYLGCDVMTERGIETLVSVGLLGSDSQRFRTLAPAMSFTNDWDKSNKPILRQLCDMTEEEAMEIIMLTDTIRESDPIKILKLNNTNIPFWIGENKIARHVSFNALNPGQFRYMLLRGLDLFGLIDAGLAIKSE